MRHGRPVLTTTDLLVVVVVEIVFFDAAAIGIALDDAAQGRCKRATVSAFIYATKRHSANLVW